MLLVDLYRSMRDQVAWRYFPARFLFSRDCRSLLSVRGWETLRFVEDAEELRRVAKGSDDLFLGGKGNEFLKVLFGTESVFLLDGEQHRAARHTLAPALSKRKVLDHQEIIDSILEEELNLLAGRHWRLVGRWSRGVAMRIMCRVLLGIDDQKLVARIFDQFEKLTGYQANIVSYNKAFWRASALLSVGTYVERMVRNLDGFLVPVLRRQQTNSGTPFLQCLLQAEQNGQFGQSFVRDNVVSFLAAGYDTTGSALSWLLYWCGRESDLVENCRSRLQAGDAEAVERFRKEVLRYCPPIDVLPRSVPGERYSEAETQLPSLPKGGMACPFVHRAHHRWDNYTLPHIFSPGRFAGQKLTNQQYMPFGAGNRMCPGFHYGSFILDRMLYGLCKGNQTIVLSSRRFRPVRRNVSIWPGFFLRMKLTRGESN